MESLKKWRGVGLVVAVALLVGACGTDDTTTAAQKNAGAIACTDVPKALEGAKTAQAQAEADYEAQKGGKRKNAVEDAKDVVQALAARKSACESGTANDVSTTTTVADPSASSTTTTTVPTEVSVIVDVRPALDGQKMPVYELEAKQGNLRNLGYQYFDDQQWSPEKLVQSAVDRALGEPAEAITVAMLLEGTSAEDALALGIDGAWDPTTGWTEASTQFRKHFADDLRTSVQGYVDELPSGKYQIYMANGSSSIAMLSRTSEEIDTAGPLVVFDVIGEDTCYTQILIDRAGNVYVPCDCGKKVVPRKPPKPPTICTTGKCDPGTTVAPSSETTVPKTTTTQPAGSPTTVSAGTGATNTSVSPTTFAPPATVPITAPPSTNAPKPGG